MLAGSDTSVVARKGSKHIIMCAGVHWPTAYVGSNTIVALSNLKILV